MANYLLDTNIISYLDDNQSPYYKNVYNQFKKLKGHDNLSLSILSIFEYQSSIASIEDIKLKNALIERKKLYTDFFNILPLSLEVGEMFASLLIKYKKNTGIPTQALKKHNFDFIIASTAIVNQHTLVSNDNIFLNIQKLNSSLQLENWSH
ncbi:MAG: PIN domain-containing protein [Campylobacterales bacterium]|nr:PIN domain-containing protein [Campylobacterales bacterium]